MREGAPRGLIHCFIDLFTLLFACSVALAQNPGFEPGHGYDQGPTDAIELRSLNPIVTQALSPSYPILEDFSFRLTAYHTGFTWERYADPNLDMKSAFFGGGSPGILGAGWYFNPGRIWSATIHDTINNCDNLESAYVSEQGAVHYIPYFGRYVGDGSRLSETPPAFVTRVFPDNHCSSRDYYVTTLDDLSDKRRHLVFEPGTGVLLEKSDVWGNTIAYTYMEPGDFLQIDPDATPDQYTFDRIAEFRHPGTGEFATEIVKAPKTVRDSLGRRADFRYGLIPGYSRFLLVEVEVDTPNGRGVYRLSYQTRTISAPPPGWPEWLAGPVTVPLLVKVELPAAGPGVAPLSYNYDYNTQGELVEIRYPSGARTQLTYGDVDVWGVGNGGFLEAKTQRGVIARAVVPLAGPVATWTYEKALYPPEGVHITGLANPILDRERTIVGDPAGNEKEYRFFWSVFPSQFGFLGAVRVYKGKAPRYDLSVAYPDLHHIVQPYDGELVRSTSYYYQGLRTPHNQDEEDSLRRVVMTTFYDDDLLAPGTRPTFRQVTTDPGVWSAKQLNAEIRDLGVTSPLGFSAQDFLPQDFARFSIAGEPSKPFMEMWRIDAGPMLGFTKTTESGNLVGLPRVIEGNYDVTGHTWGQEPSRIITQGPYRSRTDYVHEAGCDTLGDRTEVARADPNIPLLDPFDSTAFCTQNPGDVAITRQFYYPGQTPDPVAAHSVWGLLYRGGDASSPGAVEYTEAIRSRFGAVASRNLGSLAWLDTDADIGITGQAMAVRDSARFQTDRLYDDLGRPVADVPGVTTPLGRTELPSRFTYGTTMESYFDHAGANVTHTFSSSVTRTRGTLGEANYEEEFVEYDGLGHPVLERKLLPDGNHASRRRSIDALGAPTCISNWAIPEITSCEALQRQSKTTISYLDGNNRRDPFNRPTRITTPDNALTETEYFGLNSRVTLHRINGDPAVSSTTITYRDYKNRPRIIDAPEGADAIYSYDHLGNLIKVNLVDAVQIDRANLNTDRFAVLNGDGQVRRFTYDTQGRLRTATHPEQGAAGHGSTTYDQYDTRGNLLLMTDAARTQFRFTYDEAGRRVKTEEKPQGAATFRRVYETAYEDVDDPADAHGAFALGKAVTFTAYAENGTTPVQIRDLVYNGLGGRVSEERTRLEAWGSAPGDVVVTGMRYGDAGKLAELIYPNAVGSTRIPTRVVYLYAHGALVGVDSNRRSADPNVLSPFINDITYNIAGGVSSIAFANGVVETIEPDVLFRPGRITVTKAATQLWGSGLYRYDGASNIIAIGAQKYDYDRIGRLVGSVTVSPVDSAVTFSQQYAYDLYGNMIRRDGASGVPGTQVFQMDAGGTNRIAVMNPGQGDLAYQYNALGAVTNDGLHAYRWDPVGRMAGLLSVDAGTTLAEYTYDDRAYRVTRSTDGGTRETIFIRDDSGRVLSEFTRPSPSLKPHWSRDFLYALGRHISMVENVEPATPAGVASRASAPGAAPFVTLSWPAGTEADLFGYDVYRGTDPQDPTALVRITQGGPVGGTSFTDGGVSDGATYWYSVAAVDTAGSQSAATPPLRVKVGDAADPPVPSGFSAMLQVASRAQLAWTQVTDTGDESDIRGYNLYRRRSTEAWPATPRNGGLPIQGGSYIDDGPLEACTTYSYRLEAVDAAGRRSAFTPVASVSTGGGCGGANHHLMMRTGRCTDACAAVPSGHRVIGGLGSEEVGFRVRYFHVDHLGTPRVITDEQGEAVAVANLFPFGEFVPGSTTAGNTHWFTGHERDFLAGQDYMLARVYAYNASRFNSTDPRVDPFEIPGRGSLFSYVVGNPIKFWDPTGRFPLAACSGAIFLIVKGSLEVSFGAGFAVQSGGASLLVAADGLASLGGGIALAIECNEKIQREKNGTEAIEECIQSNGANDKSCKKAALYCLDQELSGRADSRCATMDEILDSFDGCGDSSISGSRCENNANFSGELLKAIPGR